MRRRLFIVSSGGFMLTSCAGGNNAAGTPSNVLTTAAGIDHLFMGVNGQPGLLQLINAAAPGTIPATSLANAMVELAAADRLLAGISQATAALSSAITLQAVQIDWNDALQLLVVVSPNVPALAPYVTLIDVATQGILLIEQFSNGTLQVNPTAPVTPAIAPVRGARGLDGRPIARTDDPDLKRSRILTMRTNALKRGMSIGRAMEILQAREQSR